MNCTSAKEKIVDAMASRESRLHGDLDQHVRECAGCRAFLASQASFTSAIDSHLRMIADEPVPPSLLPRVRARLEHEAAPHERILGWQFAALAAAVVLLAAIGVRMLRPHSSGRAPEALAQVARESPSERRAPTGTAQIQQPVARASRVAAAVRKASVTTHSSAPEVLILPEEQQAFRRFVGDISKDRASANALISVPGNGDASVEIALLTIKSVEVAPLEGTDSE